VQPQPHQSHPLQLQSDLMSAIIVASPDRQSTLSANPADGGLSLMLGSAHFDRGQYRLIVPKESRETNLENGQRLQVLDLMSSQQRIQQYQQQTKQPQSSYQHHQLNRQQQHHQRQYQQHQNEYKIFQPSGSLQQHLLSHQTNHRITTTASTSHHDLGSATFLGGGLSLSGVKSTTSVSSSGRQQHSRWVSQTGSGSEASNHNYYHDHHPTNIVAGFSTSHRSISCNHSNGRFCDNSGVGSVGPSYYGSGVGW
jgi:hypothetical protein